MNDRKLDLHEIGNTYVGQKDRFVVSLVVGYEENDECRTPEEALAHAIDLTRDGGSWDTHWYVYDRQTKTLHLLEQKQGEPDYEAETESVPPDICPTCQVAGSGPVVLRGSADASCNVCGADWPGEE